MIGHGRGGCHHAGQRGDSRALRAELPRGHVLRVMIAEHEAILGLLDRLEDAEVKVRALSSSGDHPEVTELGRLAHAIVGAEPHHQREERVLFPAIEARGIHGPPMVMRHEHEEMRALKHKLVALADAGARGATPDFGRWQAEVREVVMALVGTLRQHIEKENGVLYPMSRTVIPEDVTWERMKVECDEIGYCAFTPAEDLGAAPVGR